MTKLEALTDLLAKVKAGGTAWPYEAAEKIWPPAYGREERAAFNAFYGSLDAAMALHEAVLPGWEYGLNFDAHGEKYVFVGDGGVFETDECYSENPARAWLIAILKALIAMEKNDD